jgi:anti-anti-sigma factor
MRARNANAAFTLRLQPVNGFDAEGVRAMRERLEEVAAAPTGNVELDLSRVDFIDGSGMGAIAFLYKNLVSRGRRLMLTGAVGQPRDILERMGVARMLSAVSPSAPALAPRGFFGLLTAH